MATIRSEFTDEEWASLTDEDRRIVLDLDATSDPEPIDDHEFGSLPYDVVLDPDGHPL